MTLLRKLFSFFHERLGKTFRWLILMAFFRGVLEILTLVSIIPFVALVMNPSVINSSSSLSYLFTLSGLNSTKIFSIYFGAIILLLFIFSSLIIAYIDFRFLKKSCEIQHLTASELFNSILSKKYAYFFEVDTSEILKNLSTDVDVLRDNVVIGFFEILIKSVTCLFLLMALLAYKPLVAVIMLLTFVFSYFICFMVVKKKQGNNAYFVQKNREDRYLLIKDAMACVHEIKIFQKEGFFDSRHQKYSKNYVDLMSSNIVISKLPKTLLELISFGSVVLLILVLLALGYSNSSIITTLCIFAIAGYRLAPYLNQIYVAGIGLKFCSQTFLSLQDKIRGYTKVSFNETCDNLTFKQSIVYNNMCFKYPSSSDNLFDQINIKIFKNTTMAFIGKSGGGKSTLVNLLCGQLVPDSVDFIVDGECLEFNSRKIGAAFGFVPQKVSLLNDSVLANIAFGEPSDLIDKGKVIAAAKQSAIHDVIVALENGYDSQIGEGGIKLSGGQRQRLGIARALYFDPEILIFDEATSSLDATTEASIMKTIESFSMDKTIIIIAHRVSTVENVDYLYNVENGTVNLVDSRKRLKQTETLI